MEKKPSKSRFNLVLGAFSVLLLIVSLFGYLSLKEDLFSEQMANNTAKTQALASRVDQWLNTRKTEISTLANTPVVRSMDWNQSGPFLKEKHLQMPWFYIFAHINPDGTYYNSKVDYAEGKNLADRAHFKASIEGRIYASDPVVSRTLGTDIVAVTSPIYSDDRETRQIIGVFGGMIDTSTIVDELSRFENGPDSYAFAVNSQGVAISHPDDARRGNINTKPAPLTEDSDPGLSEAVTTMLSSETGWIKTEVDGLPAYVTYTPIKEANWYLATVTSARHVDGQFVVIDYAAAFVGLVMLGGFGLVWRSRRLEYQRLDALREVSEERSKAKSAFLANMSHELRTPLNSILGYSQILQARGGLDESAREQVQIIMNSGRYLLTLINRVLDLSKIEAGRLDIEMRTVNPTRLFNELAQVFEIERVKHKSGLSCEIAADLPAMIEIDPEKVTQVVTNVVINAFKYGDQSDVKLRISANSESQVLDICVKDQGRGMDRAQLDRLFMPFEQANNRSEGAGLGMAIVNELVTLMEGQIEVDSTVNEGTEVRIQIPYREGQSATEESPLIRRLPSGIAGDKRYSVLIVDDGKENRDFLRELLQPVGFTTTEAIDGADALERLKTARFDLMITDLVMPNLDGFDLISKVRERYSAEQLPIIVASASAFNDDQVRSLALGADEFLSKPIDMLGLVNQIAKLLKLEYRYGAETQPQNRVGTASAIDWQDEQTRARVKEILEAAELGQLVKIKQLIASIEPQEAQNSWWDLIGEAIELHDDELIIEILSEKQSN